MGRFAFVDTYPGIKLGIFYLSASLKQAGHQVDIFLAPLEDHFLDALKAFRPDFVGVSSFMGQEIDILETFIKIKAGLPETITLIGGPSVLISPDLIRHPAVDMILKGEAEKTLVRLMDEFDKGRNFCAVPGLMWKENLQIRDNGPGDLVRDFSGFPEPDRQLISKYPKLVSERTKPFLLSRGCPYACTYCGTSTLNRYFQENCRSSHYRRGSVDRVIDEIKQVKKNFGMEWVQFHDATFNADRQLLKKFLQRYKAENLPPFICNIRSEGITEELVSLLADAGCQRVTIGIQSANKRIRQTLSGRKKQTDENIIAACRLFRMHHIRVNVDMIFGWPGETIKEGLDTIRLARKAKPDGINSNVMIYYPDASITKYAHKNGFLESFPGVFDIPALCHPFASGLKNTPDINRLINFDKLVFYLVKFKILTFKPVFKILISLPPNRFYLMLKNLPALFRDLKYSARNAKEKNLVITRFIQNVLTARKRQTRSMKKALFYKNEIKKLL